MKENTKIAFVLNRGYSLFHPEHLETYGGAQIDQYLLGMALNKKGHSVSFIFHDYGQVDKERIDDDLFIYKSYPPKNLSFLPFQFIRAFKRLYQTLRRIDADIYFLEGANFELLVVSIFSRINRKKLYYRLASDIEADGRYEQENQFQGWLYKLGLNFVTKIISQTDKQNTLLEKKGYHSIVIPNTYPQQNSSGNIHGSIIWVGRLIRIKRPEIFIELAEHFPDRKFILIGQVESIDHDYASSIISKMKNISNIKYFPKINFSEINSYFQQASVLINSSTYEGFPMTFLQAMSFGVPIISFGINPDNILDKIGGSCVSTLHQGIKAIDYYSKIDNWTRTSKLSRDYFNEHYSLETVLAQYEHLFMTQ